MKDEKRATDLVSLVSQQLWVQAAQLEQKQEHHTLNSGMGWTQGGRRKIYLFVSHFFLTHREALTAAAGK